MKDQDRLIVAYIWLLFGAATAFMAAGITTSNWWLKLVLCVCSAYVGLIASIMTYGWLRPVKDSSR